MYDKSKRRKRRHNTRRCKRKLKKMYNNGYGAVCEFDKIAEVVQLPHHIIAGAIEAKCLHTARNSQIEKQDVIKVKFIRVVITEEYSICGGN